MKIAIDIRSLTDERVTGVGFYTRHLVEALAAASPFDRFTLFASGSPTVLARLPNFSAPNITVTTLNLPNRLLFLLMKLPGGPTLESFLPEPPDVWIFPKFNIFKTKLPYFLTVHDLAFDIFPEFITNKERLHNRLANIQVMTEQAKGVLAVSESTSRDLQTRWQIPNERIQVTTLGVDHKIFLPREQPSDQAFRATYDLNRPYLLALATLEPRKNLESVIEAYEIFRAQGGQELPLILSGAHGWKTGPINKLINNSQYKQDIHVLGYIPNKHKPALYRGAMVFIFPSFYEGFGLPALEAMACGVPVITSATSSLPEVTGDAAILVDPFNVNDIVSALYQLINEPGGPGLRRYFSQKAALKAQDFTWKRTAQLTLKALKRTT